MDDACGSMDVEEIPEVIMTGGKEEEGSIVGEGSAIVTIVLVGTGHGELLTSEHISGLGI